MKDENRFLPYREYLAEIEDLHLRITGPFHSEATTLAYIDRLKERYKLASRRMRISRISVVIPAQTARQAARCLNKTMSFCSDKPYVILVVMDRELMVYDHFSTYQDAVTVDMGRGDISGVTTFIARIDDAHDIAVASPDESLYNQALVTALNTRSSDHLIPLS